MLANAVRYTARLGGFGATPRSGVLSAGDSISIDLLYSTFGISGEYSGALTITSNDPNSSSVEVPVSISVTGVPDITADAPSIDFEDIYQGESIGFELNVKNIGVELLQIESINLEQGGSSFSVEDGMYDLEPQQSVNVLVEFSATILGPDTATVIFNSNDPDEPLQCSVFCEC